MIGGGLMSGQISPTKRGVPPTQDCLSPCPPSAVSSLPALPQATDSLPVRPRPVLKRYTENLHAPLPLRWQIFSSEARWPDPTGPPGLLKHLSSSSSSFFFFPPSYGIYIEVEQCSGIIGSSQPCVWRRRQLDCVGDCVSGSSQHTINQTGKSRPSTH